VVDNPVNHNALLAHYERAIMPAIASVSVSDGTNPHVFTPRGVDNSGLATLVKSSGVPIADERLTVQRSRTANGREKATFKFVIPTVVTETVNGVSRPSVQRTAYVDISFAFDGTSSEAERNVARQLVYYLMATDMAIGVIDDLEYVF